MIATHDQPEHSREYSVFVPREKNTLYLMDDLRKEVHHARKTPGDYTSERPKKDRIHPGMNADIAIFDPDTIIDTAAYESGTSL